MGCVPKSHEIPHFCFLPGYIAQSVVSLAADPGVVSLIQVRSHTFVEIDHEIITTVIRLLPLIQERVVVSYKRKCVHEVLFINRLPSSLPGKCVVIST